MPKYLKLLFGILLLFFLFSYFIENVTENIFENEKLYFMGKATFNNENLIETDQMPQHAKAVIKYENKIMNVYLPENTKNLDKIIPEVKLVSGNISIMEKEVITPNFILHDSLKRSKVFYYKEKIYSIMIFISIFIFGFLIKPFSNKKMFLLRFRYIKPFIMSILQFAIFTFIIYAYSLLPVFELDNINNILYLSISAVLFSQIFDNKFIKSIFILLGLMFFINPTYEYFIYLLGFSIVLIITINIFKNKTYNIFKHEAYEEEKDAIRKGKDNQSTEI